MSLVMERALVWRHKAFQALRDRLLVLQMLKNLHLAFALPRDLRLVLVQSGLHFLRVTFSVFRQA